MTRRNELVRFREALSDLLDVPDEKIDREFVDGVRRAINLLVRFKNELKAAGLWRDFKPPDQRDTT